MPGQKIRAKQMDLTAGWAFTTASPTAPTPTAGDSTTKLATTAFVDTAVSNAINGLTWIDPSVVIQMLGDRTIAEIDVLVPTTGQSVVAGSAGTPAAPTSDLLAIGDIAEFDGTGWKKILDNVGGFVPVDTQVIGANDGTTLFSPLTTGVDNGGILVADGIGGWTTTAPEEGNVTLVIGDGSVNENIGYAAQDSALPTSWVQVTQAGAVQTVSAGDGLANSGTAANPILDVEPDVTTGGNVKPVTAGVNGTGFDISTIDGNGLTTSGGELVVQPNGDSISVGSGGVKAGQPATGNKNTASLATTGSGDSTGVAIAATPSGDSYVIPMVNGVTYELGGGVKTEDFYFSADGGTTARAFADIVSGDILYQGDQLPFDLDTADCIALQYNTII